MDVSPIYVWTEIHVNAHYTICVLSYLINRTLTLRLHENKGKITEEVVAHEAFYEELSGGTIDRILVKNIEQSGYCLAEPTSEQKELLWRTEIEAIFTCDKILKKLNKS